MNHLIVCILLCSVVGVLSVNKISSLSTKEALDAISLIDQIVIKDDPMLKWYLQELIGIPFKNSTTLRLQLYDVIEKNSNFTKLTDLVTFQNILLLCMIGIFLVFIFLITKDLLIGCTLIVAIMVINLIISKKFIYTSGYLISIFLMIFKCSNLLICETFLRPIFIFDWMTFVFGFLVFSIITLLILNDIVRTRREKRKSNYYYRSHDNQSTYYCSLNDSSIKKDVSNV